MEIASQNIENVNGITYNLSLTGSNEMMRLSLSDFPDELILQILSYLDVNDLLIVSRISHHFRTLSLDPLLHLHRLHHASHTLSHHLSHRMPLADLLSQRIYITRTSLVARCLGLNLLKLKLNRQLARRPSVETLIEKGVLPRECYGNGDGKGKGRGGYLYGGLAPGLVEVKRRVERERVKDELRGWVEGWKGRVWEKEREVVEGGEAKVEVRWLVRRFAIKSAADGVEGSGSRVRGSAGQAKWGKRMECKEIPARAKVLGLRRFWERVGREGTSTNGLTS